MAISAGCWFAREVEADIPGPRLRDDPDEVAIGSPGRTSVVMAGEKGCGSGVGGVV